MDSVAESLQLGTYISSKLDKKRKVSYPIGTPQYWTQVIWPILVADRLAFNRYTAEPEPHGAWRYTVESRILDSVLDVPNTELTKVSLKSMAEKKWPS
ncbi:hypothetical protein Hte_008950 [Hypoxylon texense]